MTARTPSGRSVRTALGPGRTPLQLGDGRWHGVQQLDDLLGTARLVLLEEGVRERDTGKLARDEQLVVGGQQHLGGGDAALAEKRVTAEDVGRFARQLVAGRPSVAVVGAGKVSERLASEAAQRVGRASVSSEAKIA